MTCEVAAGVRRRVLGSSPMLVMGLAAFTQGVAAFVPSPAMWGTARTHTRTHTLPLLATTAKPAEMKDSSASEVSFVQTELRKEAMKLHTRDQAKEGEQEAQTPFTAWEPKRQDYLQFLVDSKLVYETFDEIVGSREELAVFRNTGLERAGLLQKDIAWFKETHDDVRVPEVGPYGQEYAAELRKIVDRSLPAFVCHFYNHYFAHTAGGRMIGKKMAAVLLDGYELNFYKWDGDVKQMLEAVRKNMDKMASGWSRQEKDECVKETAATFKYGGSLLRYIAGPKGH